jgi:hypothetical protein
LFSNQLLPLGATTANPAVFNNIGHLCLLPVRQTPGQDTAGSGSEKERCGMNAYVATGALTIGSAKQAISFTLPPHSRQVSM